MPSKFMKSLTKNKSFVVLFILCAIASLLRVYLVSQVPPGLNRDEAAIGYTAYSILKTGRDEYGVFLPLSLKSFGDWKLPGLVYATIPSVGIFGLNETAVRLPSVLAGIGTVLLTFLIAQELFQKKSISFAAAAIITFSPWHIFFSRVASEANLAAFFTALGFLLLLKAKKNPLLLLPSSIFLALPLLTYHGNHVFTPLLFLGVLVSFRKIFLSKAGIFAIGIFALIALYTYSHTLFGADKTKISGLFITSDPSQIHEHIDQNRLIYKNPLFARMLNNKVIFLIERITQNYAKSFSPEFLFISGGANRQHNIPDFGNMYLIEAPFLLLGLYFLFSKKEKLAPMLLWWILISPIGASLTRDAPHSARMFAIFPAISLVTGYGLIWVWEKVKKIRWSYLISSIIIPFYTASIVLFLSRYFVTFPYKRYESWGDAYELMSSKLSSLKAGHDETFISKPEFSPYIYYLFYQKIDPIKVQKETLRYPPTDEGFEHVRSVDGITLQKINWTDELLVPDRLYVDWADGLPSSATSSAIMITPVEIELLKNKNLPSAKVKLGDVVTSRIVDVVSLPNASPFLYFIETRIGTPSAKAQ